MEFQSYFENIKAKIEQATEYTLRTDLEILLNEIKPDKGVKIIQESKKVVSQNFGKPDFKVSKNDLELGWIETKPFGDNLYKYLNSNQLQRYLTVIPNLLFTNYRDFMLFRNGEILLEASLAAESRWATSSRPMVTVADLLNEFFDAKFQQIERTEKLSVVLAKHARFLNNELLELWDSNDNSTFKQKLKALHRLFLDTLIDDLKPADFIDAYAQTVTYGLLLAALSADKKIDKYSFIQFIPSTLHIFEEIFSLLRLGNIPDGISWIIDKIFVILNNTDYGQVQKELSFGNQKTASPETLAEDPYIYFYENFLQAYNNEKRVEKGVFYTPAAVVHFIVKATQQALVKDLKKSGLDDESVSLLDFASGTGTFLLEAFKTALQNVDTGQKNNFIRHQLLKNFFGFEFLIAPYTISHLKLTNYLKEEGFEFSGDDRAGIYLTDTLDDAHYQRNPLFPYLSDEGEQATKIKLEKKLWVIVGNPPYSNFSKNSRPFVHALIAAYKKGLSERKINLDDDYIKFIRFAQSKIEGIKYAYKKGKNSINGEIKGAGAGIVGIITNNSYLNGVTHRQMRKSLLDTFDKIYIINLHGNSIIGEPDKNVFDIQVGVSIVIYIKLEKPLKQAEVHYFSTLDNGILRREEKYNYLYNNDLDSVKWKKLKPKAPYYWFVEKDFTHQKKYDKGWSLNEIFKVYSSGIQTGKDDLVIDFEKEKLAHRIKEVLTDKNEPKIREKYKLKDTSGWQLKRFKKSKYSDKKIAQVTYRPFDFRYIYYDNFSMKRDRKAVLQHFRNNNEDFENLGLVFPRNWSSYSKWTGALVSSYIADIHLVGSQSYIAPLYIYNSNGGYDENGNGYLFKDETKKDNFTKEFREFLKKKKLQDFSPEKVFAYIYAVMFSGIYREKYFEFFKIDFPKIPFTSDLKIFEKLSAFGLQLIDNHLFRINYSRKETPTYAVEGNDKVEKIAFKATEKRLFINETQYFENFQQEIWAFEVGGYQVFDKYLKARKGKTLSYNEINHIKKTAASIKRTLKIQQKIDDLCKMWL